MLGGGQGLKAVQGSLIQQSWKVSPSMEAALTGGAVKRWAGLRLSGAACLKTHIQLMGWTGTQGCHLHYLKSNSRGVLFFFLLLRSPWFSDGKSNGEFIGLDFLFSRIYTIVFWSFFMPQDIVQHVKSCNTCSFGQSWYQICIPDVKKQWSLELWSCEDNSLGIQKSTEMVPQNQTLLWKGFWYLSFIPEATDHGFPQMTAYLSQV